MKVSIPGFYEKRSAYGVIKAPIILSNSELGYLKNKRKGEVKQND
jgi:hypothetical protein